jgi:predicted DNA-binding transcriptional regulator YafY
VYRAGWWYVVGHCRLRDALRSFRLDRIGEVTLLDKTFQPPADFNAPEFLAQGFEAETKIQIKLRFAPESAHIARDSGIAWDNIEPQSDGAMIVALTMPDLQWATSMALGFGPIVTVLAPEELRHAVRESARVVAEQYAKI